MSLLLARTAQSFSSGPVCAKDVDLSSQLSEPENAMFQVSTGAASAAMGGRLSLISRGACAFAAPGAWRAFVL